MKKGKKKYRLKKAYLLIIVFVLLIGSYFGYKFFVLKHESTRAVSEKWKKFDDKAIQIKKISGERNLDLDGIFMKIPEVLYENRDVYKDLKKEECVHYFYKNYVDEDNYGAKFTLALTNLTIEEWLGAGASEVKVMEKSVGDEYGLLSYYKEHALDDISIFTSTQKIKLYYMARNYSDFFMSGDSNYLLTGDVLGMLSVSENNFNVKLYDQKRDQWYALIFSNKDEKFFTYDSVIEIIESVFYG